MNATNGQHPPALAIGRMVEVMNGPRAKTIGTLVASHQGVGTVKPIGGAPAIYIDMRCLRAIDKAPTTQTEETMTEKRAIAAAVTRAAIQDATTEADMLEAGDLADKIRSAVREVQAARTLLAEAQAKLDRLRGVADRLLAIIKEASE